MTVEGEVGMLLGNFGFPIVAFLLMYRFSEQTLKANSQVLGELKEAITVLIAKIH